MPAKFQPPRGTRDFMPGDMLRREYVFSTIRKVFESFGFRPMETPAFESWELLGAKGGGGEAIRDEVYLFRDKGGRELGLRFDLTVPAARVVAANPQLPKPFKRYQMGPVWRYDNPQAGRFREFWQCDADIFGSSSMAAEAECIAVFARCLEELGFRDFRVRLNSRKILNGILDSAGIPSGKAPAVLRALDRLEKQGPDAVAEGMKKAGLASSQSGAVMKAMGTAGKPDDALGKARRLLKSGEAAEGIRELEEIVELSKSYGTAGRITIDLSLVRGLDYYTGPIYEITGPEKGIGSIAGGGRYDRLVELYGGRPTPATGCSLGVERICGLLESSGTFKGIQASKTMVLVAAAQDGGKLRGEAIKAAARLREAGIPAETDVTDRKLRQLFEYANRMQIPYMAMIGPDEMKSGMLALRDMRKGEQRSMPLDEIIKLLSEKL